MNPYQKVAFHTLGCKLNFAETSTIAQSFAAQGYAKVIFEDCPDVFVINTCSVTENANKECRYWVRKALKINPNGRIVIIGCYAQLKPEEITAIEGVDLVLGAEEKFNVPQYLEKLGEKSAAISIVGSIKKVNTFVPSYSLGERTRSFLKVQDGCDYFCSFCTIPLARGKSRSANIAETVVKAKEIAEKGVKEIVLTGVNVGDFGVGTEENFYALLQALVQIKNIERWRISSIEPNLLTKEIIDFVANSPVCMPHFHIPLQSGSDFILQKMRRKYNSELYQNKINYIKEKIPHACIGVDVIVGFPGESEEEFLKTYTFLQDLPISYLHVFTYSERENTGALKLLDEVIPVEIRKKRNKMLQILSQKKNRLFYESHLNTTRPVLFESGSLEEGKISGFTDNYISVEMPFEKEWVGKIIPLQLEKIGVDGKITGAIEQTEKHLHEA